MGKAKILVVEDEAIIAKDLQWRLEGMGYEVPYIVASGDEAINKAEEIQPDLILMDIMLIGEIDGIKAANCIRSKADIPVIYLTAYEDEEILERAKITEPFGYLLKPVGDKELHSNIETSLYKHRAEKKLKENEKWLSTVLSSIGDAVITTNTNGNVKSINPVAESLTGWKQEDASGKPLEEVFHIVNETPGKHLQNPVQKVLEGGTTVGLANRTILIKRDGSKIPIDNSGSPIKDEKGNILGVVLVFSDITQRRKAEALILQSKRDWEDTFNTISDMITIHDKDFNIIRANRAAEKMLGLPVLETSKAECFRFYHGTDKPPERCPSCRCLITGEPATFEYFEPHLNMYIEIRAMPRFDDNNELIGLIHVSRDISERKRIEEEVKKAKVEWEMTFDNTKEFILLIDKNFNIARCNQSFAEYANKSASEIIGQKCTDFFPCDNIPHSDTQPTTSEVQTESGRWLHLSCCPIRDEKNMFLHTIIIATDITELKNTQQRLLKSEDELKSRVKELQDFYDMAVGRELKMKELKDEIAELKNQLANKEEISK
jgi:PAS domain S-box-containing protein